MVLPRPARLVNETLAFLLEVVALAMLAWWGWAGTGTGNTALRVLAAVGLTAVAVVVWGLFAAPKASVKLPLPGVLAVKALVFGAAALALYDLGHPGWAAAFAVVVAVNTGLATLDRAGRAPQPSRS